MPSPSNAVQVGRDRFYHFAGKSYVSVTTAIDYIPKPALQSWKDREIIRAYREVMEEPNVAAMTPAEALSYLKGLDVSRPMGVGSEVHAYLEAILKGGTLPLLSEDAEAFTHGIESFLTDYKPEILESEATVYSDKYGYAGTCDIIAKIGGRTYVIDAKTGKSIWPEVALQLSAYRNADFVEGANNTRLPMPECDGRTGLALHLRPRSYSLRVVDIGDKVYDVFLSSLAIFDWIKSESGYVVGDKLELDE